MSGNAVAFLCLVTVLLATAAGVVLYIYYGRLIMRSRVVGIPLEWRRLVHMTRSGINAYDVATAYLDLRRAGVDVSLDALETYARTHRDILTQSRHLLESRKRDDSGETERILRELRGNHA